MGVERRLEFMGTEFDRRSGGTSVTNIDAIGRQP